MSSSTIWSIIISTLVLGWLIYGIIKTGRDDDKFRAKGVKTEANIIARKDVAVSGTGNMKLKLKVEFKTDKGIVTAEAKRYFTPEDLAKILRNNTVELYYLPEKPQQIHLVPQDMK